MNTANYKNLKKLELNVTKKLFKYIYNNINLNKVIEELDREYSYFYDTENNVAFNIWLSLDYIHKDGKTFTEKFLEEKSNSLNDNEKKILEERKDSYVSLFKIISYEKDHVIVRDLLKEQNFSLIDPELPNIIKEGEYVFSRIGKSLDNYNFIGDVNYLPLSSKDDFVKSVLRDFNTTRREFRGLTMRDYLKRFGLNLYKIYDEIIFNLLDSEGDLELFRLNEFQEFDEFEDYLDFKLSEDEVLSHMTNLSNIVEFYLIEQDKKIEDLPDINLNKFLNESIEDGFIGVKRELLSYIGTLKLYYQFLSKKDSSYTKKYDQILSIRKSPFEYIKKLNSYEKSFTIDRNLSHYVSSLLNQDALTLISDFDIFLIYIEGKTLDLTLKKSHIKRNDLLEINEHLEHTTRELSKAPNQKDFINIDLFYHLAIDLKILSINNNTLYFNKKAMDYLLLEDDEKYILLLQYLSSKSFKQNVLNLKHNISKEENYDFLNKLSSINKKVISGDKYIKLNTKSDFLYFIKYFKLFGLIEHKPNEKSFIRITKLGRKLSNYVLHYKDKEKKEVIINLRDFKN